MNFLKGQCHEIFDFWFFSSISFPQAYEYTSTAISNFFENSRIYLRLKVHHQPDIVQIISHGVNDTDGKFAAGVVDTGGNLPPASLTPVANLPPVSLTPVANLPPVSTTLAKFATGVVDTGGK